MKQHHGVAILGVFVADVAFHAERQPRIGETLIGSKFQLGPGGKGSNQAVAVARLGMDATFITKLGTDTFADLGFAIWSAEGVTPMVDQSPDGSTGAAYIFVDERSGDNAIIICPGVARTIDTLLVEKQRKTIESSAVFITQFEQPIDAAMRALEIAKSASVTTILNPAPAVPVDEAIYPLCDYITPNETETEALTAIAVRTGEDAQRAGDYFLARGVGAALITLGEGGSYIHSSDISKAIPSVTVAETVETTGAGDAFNGGFATALARGMDPVEAANFASAAAGISVTRPGTAPSMPTLSEVELALQAGCAADPD